MTINIPIGKRRSQEFREFAVREFFQLDLDESASPFLTPFARQISKNLPLKASLFAAILLALSYSFSFWQSISPVSFLFLAATYLIVGIPALINSLEDILIRKDINIDVLMTVAAFSSIFIGTGFEGALLLVLFALSGAIEDAVAFKAKQALLSIHSLVPTKACVMQDGLIVERAIQDVSIGSLILVRAGEIVPLDGIVREGSAQASFAHLTGESLPLRKEVGDEIASGARIIDSALVLQVTHISEDSTVSKIVQLITKAQSAKPRLEKTFDRFGRVYAISIMLFSFFVAVTFPSFLDIAYLGNEGSLYRALAFLITASPCALILAVPTAYLSSLGASAKKGIVLKGGVILDALAKCKAVAFDKTGTLTLGELTLDISDDLSLDLLSSAAGLERNAVHPIAKAIVSACQEKKVAFAETKEVTVIPGYGVEGLVRGEYGCIGDIAFIASKLARGQAEEVLSKAKTFRTQGKVVAGLMIGQKGYVLSFSDHPRPRVALMIERLKAMKYRLFMLTGDSRENASIIAKLVGIDHVEAELKPEDKLRRIEELSQNEGLAMCGDGINDAPALARATVGIAMGQVSSATARQAADVIFLHDTIEQLDWLFEKALQNKKIVAQNLIIALTAIVCGSVPALFGVLPLWLAVIVHEGGTVLVGLNALRLLRR